MPALACITAEGFRAIYVDCPGQLSRHLGGIFFVVKQIARFLSNEASSVPFLRTKGEYEED